MYMLPPERSRFLNVFNSRVVRGVASVKLKLNAFKTTYLLQARYLRQQRAWDALAEGNFGFKDRLRREAGLLFEELKLKQ
jgi:hypothetical protein